jgi:hypothetical protein
MYPHIRWREWLARRGSITCRLQPVEPQGWRAWKAALIPAVVVLVALVLQAAAVRVPVLGRGWAHLAPADSAISLLPELRAYEKASPPGTPIFNDMFYGGFLIYHTPGLRVFIDDRCELYGDRWLEQYAEAYRHHPEQIEQWTREYGFDHALVIPDSVLDRYLQKADGWTEVRRTPGAALYRRACCSQ